jgi:hypothetical protein
VYLYALYFQRVQTDIFASFLLIYFLDVISEFSISPTVMCIHHYVHSKALPFISLILPHLRRLLMTHGFRDMNLPASESICLHLLLLIYTTCRIRLWICQVWSVERTFRQVKLFFNICRSKFILHLVYDCETDLILQPLQRRFR